MVGSSYFWRPLLCPALRMVIQRRGIGKRSPHIVISAPTVPDLLTVGVVNGVATQIGPNFAVRGLHPADGKICVKPYGLIQKLYSPHRILKPLKRTNPKKGRAEDPGWVETSWEEALDIVAEKLRGIRGNFIDEDGNPRLAFTTGEAGTSMRYMGAFPAFFAAWGGPIDKSVGAGGTVACYHSEHLYCELWHRAFCAVQHRSA